MKVLRHSLVLLAGTALAGVAGVGASPAAAQSYPGAAAPAMAGFGQAVAVAGDQVLVGEPDNNIRPGTVYVYGEGPDGAWREIGSFTAPGGEPGDGFGLSLSADGADRVLVGSEGAAHLFERSGIDWRHVTTLRGTGMTGDEGFGSSVALSGDVALVGAPGRAEGAGAVVVYRGSGASWSESATLTMEGAENRALFGAALAMDGSMAVVGAPGAGNRTGSAALYRFGPGEPQMVTTLTPPAANQGDRFGTAVAIGGGHITVGSPAFAGGIGRATVFRSEAGEWVAEASLLPFDGGPGATFAMSLAVQGSTIWAGAPGVGSTGAAYAFTHDEEGLWNSARKLVPEAGSSFAGALAVGDDVVAFGMPRADYGAGQAAIFAAEGDGEWVQRGQVLSELESYPAVTGGQVDCESGAATAFACGDVDLLAFLPTEQMGGSRGVRMNDVWGWTDSETGREYALAGMMDQTSFVDISDPSNPVYVGRLPMTPGARANAWRDIKVYDDHAFVVADGAGQHGMQVFDLTRLRDFDGTPETFEPDALYENIASAHNIVINEAEGMAFAVGSSSGGETCGGGLHMIDIGDPLNPTFAGCFADPQTGRASTGYSHDAQCVTYEGPDEEYRGREVCFGANETALSVADVTDKANPVALSRAAYPNVGYTHQGWLTEDHSYFYMNDELDELQGKVQGTRTLIWDVRDLEDPQLVMEHYGTTEASDHNLYIVGDLMYQSNYQAGLQILDISDRENPEQVGFFDTVPYGTNTPSFGGSWSNFPFFESGVVIVTSGNEGLFILKPNDERIISD